MKICEKCGKEFADEIFECPDCTAKAQLYENVLKNAKIMNIVASVIMAVGTVCALFVNAWLGAILCFVTEIVCLIPNTKIQKLFKQNNAQTTDKKKLKADNKALTKELKSKNKDYKFSFIIALVALVLLIAFVICDSVLAGWANSLPSDLQKDSYGSGIVNQIDTIGDLHQYANSKFHNYSDNSTTNQTASDDSNKYATEPIVGSFDYFESRDADTMTSITISKPYINHMKFEADGTGNLTLKTDTSTGFSLYTTTWELVESADTARKYAVHTNTNETIYVFYYEDLDTCSTFGTLNGRTVMNVFKRYSGNAQDNASGATTIAPYDVVGSYRFTHAYNPNTGYKTTTPPVPYTYYLTFYESNSCLVQAQTNTTSSAYGLEFYNGSWSYDKQESGYYHYTIILNNGSSSTEMAVLYMPEDDVCVVSDTSGNFYYLERVVD